MPDWTKTMQQTFEYYTVDPVTWNNVKKIDFIKSSNIDWDLDTGTINSLTMETDESIDETYIRIYLSVIQNGVNEKFPLGTFLVQTLPSSFDGKSKTISVDAYSPLIELKEDYPDLGYTIKKNENIMERAYQLLSNKEIIRAPVVKATNKEKLHSDFVADTQDTYLDFISSLISNAKYNLMLDEMGRVLFAPKQKIEALQPVWTYNDDNSSILYPDISVDRDLYGIPNVVEVMASSETETFYAIVENNDPNSPTSIVNRGRRIKHRDINPKITGAATQESVEKYAEDLLKELSSLEHTVTYTHGYCPVRVGDCVRLNYSKFGLNNVKAKVVSQSIKCVPGCPVTEKAVFTTKYYGGR